MTEPADWLAEARKSLHEKTIILTAAGGRGVTLAEDVDWLQKIIAAAENPTHDQSRSLELGRVKVTLTKRSAEFAYSSGTDPDTVLVFIDTDNDDADTPIPVSIQVNDSDLWEGLVPGTSNLDGMQED